MKLIKFTLGFVYYLVKAFLTSPMYACRRAKSFASGNRKRRDDRRGRRDDGPTFISDPADADSTQPAKRRRRGHRGGRKHKRHHNK